MKDGKELDELVQDLSLGAGLGMINKNRRPGERGVAHGGVAVIWKESVCSLKQVDLKVPNPQEFEVLVAAGSLHGHTRKLVVVACYIPPNYSKKKGNDALEYVSDTVVELKRRFKDPYLLIAGDFNQWKVDACLEDFVDLKEAMVGPTRGGREIDRIFTNMSRKITESGTLSPLETEEESIRSDHRVAYCRMTVPRHEKYVWERYTYRHYTQDAEEAFKRWIVMYPWTELVGDSNDMAEAYQKTITTAIETFFPLRTTSKKSTDLPWMTKKIRKEIRGRRRLYWQEGGERTDLWKEEKKRVAKIIYDRKKVYLSEQKRDILADDANRNFFKHVRNFSRLEKPKIFDVRTLLPGKTDEEVAEILADYFNKVSQEFDPLLPEHIPVTAGRRLPELQCWEVAKRIKSFRKPKSTVPGDVFPGLVTKLADFFAIPLTTIYNRITETKVWPRCWKKEFVTIIPKKTNPESLGDLRNISCTMLASKMYESYMLDWMKEEVQLRRNQYGGVKGLGTDHVLAQLWQEVLENIEDYRAGTLITSIDYSKAFNRMSYQECLKALAKKGASTEVLRLIATFLTNRTMTVKVGNSTMSRPRQVTGGCPQGSILGVFLFNLSLIHI